MLKSVEDSAPNGVYIHDRRGGTREEVVNVRAGRSADTLRTSCMESRWEPGSIRT